MYVYLPSLIFHLPCSLVEYVKDAVRLVASREMHVCATFARRFYWSDLNLWPEDLAPGSVVLLSGKVCEQRQFATHTCAADRAFFRVSAACSGDYRM